MLSTQFATEKYGVEPVGNYGVHSEAYHGPQGAGASYQVGNKESTRFFFGRKMLRDAATNPIPLANSKATYTEEVGKLDTVGNMGSVSPVHPHQIDSTEG
jgi:hypothetical protein